MFQQNVVFGNYQAVDVRCAKSREERWQKLAYTLNESPIRCESRSYSTSTALLFTHSIPTLQSKEEEHEQPRG